MNWNDYFIADFEAGTLTWKTRTDFGTEAFQESWNKRYAGKRAGWVDYRGYWRVELFGNVYRVHQILYVMANGPIPDGYDIDHWDQNKGNNSRGNLRLATRAENGRNRGTPSNNTTGVKGVAWHKARLKWQAQIAHQGRQIYLGLYDDINDAIAARAAAEEKYHGEFAPKHN